MNLGKVVVPVPLTARIAYGALAGGQTGGFDMGAMMVMLARDELD
jgi:hypothetical protein